MAQVAVDMDFLCGCLKNILKESGICSLSTQHSGRTITQLFKYLVSYPHSEHLHTQTNISSKEQQKRKAQKNEIKPF